MPNWVCLILVGTALAGFDGTVRGMSYTSDLTDEQWALLEPVFNTPGKRGPRHAAGARSRPQRECARNAAWLASAPTAA